MRPDDLPPEWLDRTSIVHLNDNGDVVSLEFVQALPPLATGVRAAVGHDRLNDDWRTRPMLDVTEEIGLILDDLGEHPTVRQQTADALIELFNRHVDHHQRRVRCTAVIVRNDKVIGYTLGTVPFHLDGRPLQLNGGQIIPLRTDPDPQ